MEKVFHEGLACADKVSPQEIRGVFVRAAYLCHPALYPKDDRMADRYGSLCQAFRTIYGEAQANIPNVPGVDQIVAATDIAMRRLAVQNGVDPTPEYVWRDRAVQLSLLYLQLFQLRTA